MELDIEELDDAIFAPYGEVLRAAGDRFSVVVSRPAAPGWQAALNRVIDATTGRVHRHPSTDECFSPVRGSPVLLVAAPSSPDEVRAFALTEPVRVAAGTWHALLAPARALVFICEAAGAAGEDHDLAETRRLPGGDAR